MAVVLTFAASGAIHDLFATLVLARYFVLFTPVFAIFGSMVIVEEALGSNLLGAPYRLRAGVHAMAISGTIAFAVVAW